MSETDIEAARRVSRMSVMRDPLRPRPGPNVSPAGRPINTLRATGVSPSIEESYAIQEVARECGIVLEVGTAWGYSAILMALTGCQVWTIDPHTDFNTWDEFHRMLKEYDVRERVRAFRETSQYRLPLLAETGAKFDAVFIDGDHSYAGCHFDLVFAKRLVRPGGWIMVHDFTPPWPGVWEACHEEFDFDGGPVPGERVVETLLVVRMPE